MEYKLIKYSENGNLTGIFDLLGKDVDVNTKDATGSSPLHYTASNGDIEIFRTLIKYGANINSVDMYKNTPLIIAAKAKNNELVHELLLNNANVTIKNYLNKKAIDYVSDQKIKNYLHQSEVQYYCYTTTPLIIRIIKSKYVLSFLTLYNIIDNYTDKILSRSQMINLLK